MAVKQNPVQDDTPRGDSTIYVTKEQAARIAALTIDALVGAQLRSDASDQSYVLVDSVHIDDGGSSHYVVYTDGSFTDVT